MGFDGEAAYYDQYIASSSHTEFDPGYFRSHTAANRWSRADVPNPHQIGAEAVADYFEVVQLCTYVILGR